MREIGGGICTFDCRDRRPRLSAFVGRRRICLQICFRRLVASGYSPAAKIRALSAWRASTPISERRNRTPFRFASEAERDSKYSVPQSTQKGHPKVSFGTGIRVSSLRRKAERISALLRSSVSRGSDVPPARHSLPLPFESLYCILAKKRR